MSPDLIDVTTLGIKGSNFYWSKREYYGITDEELRIAGVKDGAAYVHPDLAEPLKKAATKFRELGFELVVKDAYRSKELYELAQIKRYEKVGKALTDRLLNMKRMPHATGRVVDVALVDPTSGAELALQNPDDGADGAFIDFYKEKPDPESQEYQRRQELLIKTMESCGFRTGPWREIWHFEYGLAH